MAKIIDKIKRCVMAISFQERKKRELISYKQKIESLKKMDTGEIDLEYINLKSEYEHKKNILSFFLVCVLISIVIDVWRYFYVFLEKGIHNIYLYSGNDVEVTRKIFITFIIMMIFIIAIVFLILIMHIKSMYRTYKDLIMVEENRKK